MPIWLEKSDDLGEIGSVFRDFHPPFRKAGEPDGNLVVEFPLESVRQFQ